MKKQRRSRKEMRRDSLEHYGGMAEKKPDQKASDAFHRPAYECTDVIGYLSKKFDVKGEIGSGQERSD